MAEISYEGSIFMFKQEFLMQIGKDHFLRNSQKYLYWSAPAEGWRHSTSISSKTCYYFDEEPLEVAGYLQKAWIQIHSFYQ